MHVNLGPFGRFDSRCSRNCVDMGACGNCCYSPNVIEKRIVASEKAGRIGSASKESASRSESMLEVAHAVILFGIIFGAICYATAVYVCAHNVHAFTGLGCVPCDIHIQRGNFYECTVQYIELAVLDQVADNLEIMFLVIFF